MKEKEGSHKSNNKIFHKIDKCLKRTSINF